MKVIAIVCVVSTACVDEVDQRWDLDHDHVAVPVTAFQRANITGVVMHGGAPVAVESLEVAVGPQVDERDPLCDVVAFIADGWYVTSPSDALAAIRARDGLAADAPATASDALAVPIDHDVYVSVEGDRVAGELSVVIRDTRGGVAWRVWPIRGER